jgi:hypothetical protein
MLLRAMEQSIDLTEQLRDLIGVTGGVEDHFGGYRIKIFHTRAFPWDEVFKLLLYRDFTVYVGRQKADIYIEAKP